MALEGGTSKNIALATGQGLFAAWWHGRGYHPRREATSELTPVWREMNGALTAGLSG